MIVPFRHLRARKDKVSAKQYNRLVDLVEMMANSMLADGIMAGGQILKRRVTGSGGGINIKIFEVQSVGTGDGIYNCYEQSLDATEWADTAGDDRFDDKNETSVEVLNLVESHCHSNYAGGLAVGDRMHCWQWLDDEGTNRWVGVPFALWGMVRPAMCQGDAGATTLMSVKLVDVDGNVVGDAFNAICPIAGGTALNAAIPRLEEDDVIFITNIGGIWYNVQTFQASEDCDCYEAP